MSQQSRPFTAVEIDVLRNVRDRGRPAGPFSSAMRDITQHIYQRNLAAKQLSRLGYLVRIDEPNYIRIAGCLFQLGTIDRWKLTAVGHEILDSLPPLTTTTTD